MAVLCKKSTTGSQVLNITDYPLTSTEEIFLANAYRLRRKP